MPHKAAGRADATTACGAIRSDQNGYGDFLFGEPRTESVARGAGGANMGLVSLTAA